MAVAIPRGEALPFARGQGPVSKAEPPKPLPEPPRPVAPTNSPSAAPAVDPPSQCLAAPTQPVRAPVHAPPLDTPPIPLERHASLCVEIAIAPNRTQETLVRYQMTAETKVVADNYWRAKMSHDPETRAAWERAFNVYRDWLAQNTPAK